MKQVVFLTVNHRGPLSLRELYSTDDKRSSVNRPWGILSPFSTRFRLQVNSPFQRLSVTQTYICMWCLCETGRFSYGESPRTPPLEGTSLHRRNNSVERPCGILSLFTTCSVYVSILSRVCRWHRHIYVCGVFVKQVVFLTVNHRGPLPLRELHSTEETIVWRDPGGLSLFTIRSEFTLPEVVTHTSMVFVEQATWSSLPFLPSVCVGSSGSGGGGGGGITQLFPITNGSHTSTWPTSELNHEHVLGNMWTCGLRSKLKHSTIMPLWLRWQPEYISLRNRN